MFVMTDIITNRVDLKYIVKELIDVYYSVFL